MNPFWIIIFSSKIMNLIYNSIEIIIFVQNNTNFTFWLALVSKWCRLHQTSIRQVFGISNISSFSLLQSIQPLLSPGWSQELICVVNFVFEIIFALGLVQQGWRKSGAHGANALSISKDIASTTLTKPWECKNLWSDRGLGHKRNLPHRQFEILTPSLPGSYQRLLKPCKYFILRKLQKLKPRTCTYVSKNNSEIYFDISFYTLISFYRKP